MSINSYEKLYGRVPEDRESPPIDLLAETRPEPLIDPVSRASKDVQDLVHRIRKEAGMEIGPDEVPPLPPLHPETQAKIDAAKVEMARRDAYRTGRVVQAAFHGLAADLAPAVQLQAAQTMSEAQARGIRPSRDEFFFRMAELASTMATCPRAHCGAVIVRHKRPLSVGYNGSEDGEPHCPSEGESLAEHLAVDHCAVSVHAEVNALKNATGNVYGATIYVYGHYAPCVNCQDELARVGITDIRHRPGPHYGVKR